MYGAFDGLGTESAGAGGATNGSAAGGPDEDATDAEGATNGSAAGGPDEDAADPDAGGQGRGGSTTPQSSLDLHRNLLALFLPPRSPRGLLDAGSPSSAITNTYGQWQGRSKAKTTITAKAKVCYS
jgi:hypothetical protein